MSIEKNRKGPLTDLRVIELGQLIAGPFCGQLFADMGADVIKVEAPGRGDPMRVWGREGYPLWWKVCARNKRCITANLREEAGQDIVKQLVKEADFILENFRPGTMEKWGLGYEEGDPDRKPSRAGISLGDSLAGTYATVGALAALHHREKTGEGQVIDTSIYESILTIMESLVSEHTVEGFTRERSGSILPAIAPSNIYDGSDGMVIIAANQDTIFARLSDAIGQPDLKTNPRYATHTARGANQTELDDIIQDWTKDKSIAEIESVMIENAVPVGKVYRAKEMLDDPHYIARDALIDVQSDKFGTVKMQNVFPKMSKTQGEVRWGGPEKLGAHTEEVLTEILDLTPEQIEKLRSSGIV